MSAVRARIAAPGAAALLALLLAVAAREAGAAAEPAAIAGRTLTLQECVSLGLSRNPAAEIAAESLAAARERAGEAKAGWYPSLRFSAGYTYTTPGGGAAGVPGAPEDSFDTRFSLRQSVYDAGQTSNAVAGAAHAVEAQASDVRKVGLDIVVNVQAAYYEVLRRRDFIEVVRGALRSTEQHAEQARELYREGLAPRSDVIKAEVQVSSAQLEIIRAENALLLAKAGLAAAMGLPVTTDYSVAEPESGESAPVPALQEALALAASRRPEPSAAAARVAVAEAAVRQARGGLYPNVSLDAAYGWQESDFVPLDRKWSVGVSVGLPLFERRAAQAKVGRAAAERNVLAAARTQTLRAIELEVEQAWLLLQEATERTAVTERIRGQAAEDLGVSEGRYREGLGTMLEVIDARTVLTQAAANAVIARYDRAQARARLERALGTGMPEEVRP